MNIGDINGWELIIILTVAFVLIGPERLPEYAAKLGRAVRRLRRLADGATAQLREQMGPEFDEIDWKSYDPRQYDPRRIVRDALADETPEAAEQRARAEALAEPFAPSTGNGFGYTPDPAAAARIYRAERPTPYDVDST